MPAVSNAGGIQCRRYPMPAVSNAGSIQCRQYPMPAVSNGPGPRSTPTRATPFLAARPAASRSPDSREQQVRRAGPDPGEIFLNGPDFNAELPAPAGHTVWDRGKNRKTSVDQPRWRPCPAWPPPRVVGALVYRATLKKVRSRILGATSSPLVRAGSRSTPRSAGGWPTHWLSAPAT